MVVPVICPSMLSSDFSRLAEEAAAMLAAGADWLHMDVMDGHFVPNLTIGAPVIKSLRAHTRAYLDCHLMVTSPEQWIDDFAAAGASGLTFHVESTRDPRAVIERVRAAGMRVGVAIKPGTPVDSVAPFLDAVDLVLVMSVEPGFGGQAFMPSVLDKVRALRRLQPSLDIQIDGGVGGSNIAAVAEAGANVIVAGTSVFKHAAGAAAAIADLRAAVATVTGGRPA